MGNNNKAPGLFGADAGAMLSKRYGKYNGFYLTPQQHRLFVYNFLVLFLFIIKDVLSLHIRYMAAV